MGGDATSDRNKVEETMKRKLLLAAVLAVAAAGLPRASHAADAVKIVIPDNSVLVLNWMGAKDAGIFTKHNIDADIDVRPFAGYLASLPAKQTPATSYSGLDAIAKMNDGLDLQMIGGGLTVFQEVFVRKDSPIKTVADLKGKKFGVWATGSGAFKAARVAMIDAAGVDVMKDATIVQLAPPALFKLLERGDIDAMLNISTFSINATAQPDKYRAIFSPNDYWKKKTGYPLVFSAPLVAWADWVKENPTRAKNFTAAVEESFRWLEKPANFDTVVEKYGKLAGVTTPEAKTVYKKWLSEQKVFLSKWDQKVIDSQWQFLELAKTHGVLDKVPSKKEHAISLE
jgi:ABC-type nitrate/sulfonate/bicarbonate transport system substrate-binding protein